MTMPILEEYIVEADRARDYLLSCATRHKESVPPAGRWSAADVLEHCCITEKSIAGILLRADRIATPCEPMSDDRLTEERHITTGALSDRTRRVMASDRLQPVEHPDFEVILANLQRSREALFNAARARSDLQLRSMVFAHPLRGDLSLYGWLWFAACHERRHAEQIVESATAG